MAYVAFDNDDFTGGTMVRIEIMLYTVTGTGHAFTNSIYCPFYRVHRSFFLTATWMQAMEGVGQSLKMASSQGSI